MVAVHLVGFLAAVSFGCVAADRLDILFGSWALVVGLLWLFQDAVRDRFEKAEAEKAAAEKAAAEKAAAEKAAAEKVAAEKAKEAKRIAEAEKMSELLEKWPCLAGTSAKKGVLKDGVFSTYTKKVDVYLKVEHSTHSSAPFEEARLAWHSKDPAEPECKGIVLLSGISATADREELNVSDGANGRLLVFKMADSRTADTWRAALADMRECTQGVRGMHASSPRVTPVKPRPRLSDASTVAPSSPGFSSSPSLSPASLPKRDEGGNSQSDFSKSHAPANPWNAFRKAVGGYGMAQKEISDAYAAKQNRNWNGFRKAIGGHGFSQEQISKLYHM
jgi:hypothetical protein